LSDDDKKQKGVMRVEVVESVPPDERTHFRTSDIPHAAALQSSGHKLVEIATRSKYSRGRQVRKTEFVFIREGVSDTLVAYSNNKLQVDARTLIDNYRNLKAMSFGRGITK
jgi:hypothetical protein